jgi:hypothetical protein
MIDPPIHVAVWIVSVGRVPLYLLDTDIEINDPRNRKVLAHLYIGDVEQRLRQEIVLGIGHAFVYRWLSRAWPAGIAARAWRMALLLFFLSYLFWEFFTPLNQFGEPLPLVGIELFFWAIIALSEALVIAAVMEGGRRS